MYITVKQLKVLLEERTVINDDGFNNVLCEHNLDYAELIDNVLTFAYNFVHENAASFHCAEDIINMIMDQLHIGSEMYSSVILVLTPEQRLALDAALYKEIDTNIRNYYDD